MKKTTVAVVMLIFFPCFGYAEKDLELEAELKALHEAYNYTVTASKVLEKVDKSIATVTVITEQQIHNMGARHLLDVLRIVPGLGITQSEFGFRDIEARGIKTVVSEKVLFMLNGHPADNNLQNAGSVYLYDDLPIDNIKQVEVVRGTGSALYGANAFLATINIITKKPEDLNGVELAVRGGSFNTQQYHLAAGKNFDGLKIGTDFHYTDTDGIHALISEKVPGATGQPTSAPGYTKPHEKRYDLGWNAEYKGFKLDGRFINKKTGTFIGYSLFGPDSQLEWQDYFIRAAYEAHLTDKLTATNKLSYSSFSFDNIWQLQPHLFFRGAVTGSKLTNETQFNYQINANNTLIAGLLGEWQKQDGLAAELGSSPNTLQTAPSWGVARNRFLGGVYVQDMWDILPNLRLQAGARYDYYNDFGGTFNPRVGFNWQITENYALRFSYGTAFRAPSFGETSLINNAALLGNPNLRPEKIETFELGFSARFFDNLQSQLTLYQSNIKDLINLQPTTIGPLEYQNQGQTTARGIELEGKYNFTNNTYLAFNYVYQNTENEYHKHLADVPQHRANLIVNAELTDHVNFYIDALIKGNTGRDIGDKRPKVSGYGLINTALTINDIGFKNWSASFSVFNLLNKRTVSPTALGSLYNDMPQAERGFFGAIKIKF